MEKDLEFMRLALAEAMAAGERGEVPAGAVLVGAEGKILAQAGNACISLRDPTAHAEVLVLREAGLKMGNYRLAGTSLYATLEPCPMCLMAMVHARIERLVYGAREAKTGAVGSLIDLPGVAGLNHQIRIEGGLLAEECQALIQDFFKEKRRRGTEEAVTGTTRNRLVRC